MTETFLSEIVGSFAMPAAENPTVAIMEAAFRHHGLDWRYLNCEVSPQKLKAAVDGAAAMGWAGFNCSIPHKIAVIEHIAGLGKSAEIIGAVNTMIAKGDSFVGENTDGRGFVEAISAITDLAGKKVVMFGAGGAARALGVELALAGISELAVVNRSKQRGRDLAALVDSKTPARADYLPWAERFAIPRDAEMVVNATSIGLYPDLEAKLDIDWSSLEGNMLVADGVHNPPNTHLIRSARDKGCTVLDGLGMLVNVCAICIDLWTGVRVEKQVMRDAVINLNG